MLPKQKKVGSKYSLEVKSGDSLIFLTNFAPYGIVSVIDVKNCVF